MPPSRLALSYNSGAMAALAHFKIAETVLGASPGVAPRGDEVSHGTDRIPYANLDSPHDEQTDALAKAKVDSLWNISDYDHWAPGTSGGSYGQEVIG